MTVQLTPLERKRRRRLTAQQKLAILRDWEASGNGVAVPERHGIYPMTLYRWRKRLEIGAVEFLRGTRARVDPRMRELEQENQKLRDTVTPLSQELMALKIRLEPSIPRCASQRARWRPLFRIFES